MRRGHGYAYGRARGSINAGRKKSNSSGGIQKPACYGIIALMLFGVIAGTIAANFMDEGSRESIRSYLNGFFGAFDKNSINLKTTFIDSLYKYARIIAAIWVAGFFTPGLVIIAGIILFKSFAYGFTTAALVKYYGFYGFVVGFGSYIPQNIFFMPAMVLGAYSGIVLIYNRLVDTNRAAKPASGGIAEYCAVLLIGLLCCAVAALTETYLTPALIEYTMPL